MISLNYKIFIFFLKHLLEEAIKNEESTGIAIYYNNYKLFITSIIICLLVTNVSTCIIFYYIYCKPYYMNLSRCTFTQKKKDRGETRSKTSR